jgi:hypothetical protein
MSIDTKAVGFIVVAIGFLMDCSFRVKEFAQVVYFNRVEANRIIDYCVSVSIPSWTCDKCIRGRE